ncbi:MAG: hypothetical protein M3Z25_03410 [Actinomycetota bacterium]|nr:hypothetical protein [Actinomycetota bacterium]
MPGHRHDPQSGLVEDPRRAAFRGHEYRLLSAADLWLGIPVRRAGLFNHPFNGIVGANVLFDMDVQFGLPEPRTALNPASHEVVYQAGVRLACA